MLVIQVGGLDAAGSFFGDRRFQPCFALSRLFGWVVQPEALDRFEWVALDLP